MTAITRTRPAAAPPCRTCGEPKELHIRGFVWPRLLAEDVHDGAIDATVKRNGVVMVGDQVYARLTACRYRKGRSRSEAAQRGRANVKRGNKAETLVAKQAEARQGGGAGGIDVRTDEDAIEVKVMPKNVRSHIEQAQRLRGYREAVVRYVDIGREIWELRRL